MSQWVATPEVALRPLAGQDVPTLYEYQREPRALAMAIAYPRSREEYQAHVERMATDPTVTARAIVADGRLAGIINCFRRDDRTAIGYWLGREFWGRGIATRAVALLLEEVSARPIIAWVARSNVASLRVLQKCGFRIEGYRWAPADENFPECEEAVLVLE